MPVKIDMPISDTDRAMSSEPDADWPDEIAIVATKGKKRKRIVISKDHYYGTGSFGAPMNGQWLIFQIGQLVKRMT